MSHLCAFPRQLEGISVDVENVNDYLPGGYHPVHFGHTFKNHRYKVLRKLGYGSFSTVWLARDAELSRYVALKIITAAESQLADELSILRYLKHRDPSHPGREHVIELLDSFEHEGPNGTHLCLVFDVMGPDSQSKVETYEGYDNNPGVWRYPYEVSKEISRQVILGLDYLHKSGVVHGDIQPGNWLFTIPNLDSFSEEELTMDVEESKVELFKKDWSDIPQYTPDYLAASLPLYLDMDLSEGFTVKISDMGGASRMSKVGRKSYTYLTPIALRPPEFILGQQWDTSVDIWSMGCMIFEVVTGIPLFDLSEYDSSNDAANIEHLIQMEEYIGKLPVGLVSNLRPSRYVDYHGRLIVPGGYRRILQHSSLEKYLSEEVSEDFPRSEIPVLASLLRSMLQYRPEDRKGTSELLEHPWFAAEMPSGQTPISWSVYLLSLYQWVGFPVAQLLRRLKRLLGF